MSTDQISVDTSDLLHTEEQILRSKREACFLDEVSSLRTCVA